MTREEAISILTAPTVQDVDAVREAVEFAVNVMKKEQMKEVIMLTFQDWEAEEAGELQFGDRVAILLAKKNMSQRELAKKVGTTEVSISRYINNSRCPKGPMIVAIAKALGVSIDFLLGVKE